MTYARYKSEILGSLVHAAKTAHEAHVRSGKTAPGYVKGERPTTRQHCEKPLCAVIEMALAETRAL